MTTVERYESLKTKAIQIKAQTQQAYNTCLDVKAQYDEVTEKYKADKESLNVQTLAIDTLKEIIDKLSQAHVERVVSLLTYSLQSIFFDKNYSVEIVTSDKRNSKTADMILVEQTGESVIRAPFNEGIGGGVMAVCGLVLQVYYLNLLNQAPVIFLDEQLSQVSSEYIPTLMAFIKELSDKKNLIVVLVTHDQRIMQYADKTYLVEDGVVSEVKRNV